MDHKRFFGFHFDFHAGNETEIGLNTDPADIEWYIDQGKPDFIQCDCKGHPGNCSYPTQIGNPADKLMATTCAFGPIPSTEKVFPSTFTTPVSGKKLTPQPIRKMQHWTRTVT